MKSWSRSRRESFSGGQYEPLSRRVRSNSSSSCNPEIKQQQMEAVERGDWEEFERLGGKPNDEWLQVASQAGTLMEFLELHELPLANYPSIAKLYLEDAEQWFLNYCREYDPHDDKYEHVRRRGKSSKQATMLSNFILVPGVPVDCLMKQILQDMVVFRQDNSFGTATPVTARFPEKLGSFYLRRKVEWKRSALSYNVGSFELTVSLPGKAAFTVTTSELFPITLPDSNKSDVQIPHQAKYFTYVYHDDKNFHVGGFLYLGSDLHPLVVSQLSTEVEPYALSFGRYQPLGVQGAKAIRNSREHKDVTVPPLKEAGAELYMFLGPDKELGEFKGGPIGGFAYVFAKEEESRYFPIQNIGEVIDRGQLEWEVNAALFSSDPDVEDIQARLTNAKAGSDVKEQVDVNIARVGLVDALNPIVLHALQYTPCLEVLDTPAAKAIATVAYCQVFNLVILDVAFNFGTLVAVTWFTKFLRAMVNAGEAPETWKLQHDLCLLWIAVSWLTKAFQELAFLVGCRRRCWPEMYQNYRSVGSWGWLLLVVLLLYDLLEVREKGVYRGRELLAAVGCMTWLRVLWTLRVLHIFKVGLRVLPIVGALSEASSFLFVTSLILGSSYQVSYALTNRTMSHLLFNTFRMGFTGEMEDSLFLNSDTKSASLRGFCEKAAYCAFAFLVLVSMANIFIYIIGEAFAKAQKKVVASFVRARVQVSLEYFVIMESIQRLCRHNDGSEEDSDGLDEDKFIWLCYQRKLDDKLDVKVDVKLDGKSTA